MPRWTLPTVLLILLILALVAYLSYQGAVQFLRYTNINQIQRELYGEQSMLVDGQNIDRWVARVREADQKYDGAALKGMLFDLLLYQAWYEPEQCEAPLAEAMELGHELLSEHEAIGAYAALQLTWAYLYAGLPGKVEQWQSEVIAREPGYLTSVRLYQFWARIMADDLDGAEALIAEELQRSGSRFDVNALALASYYVLGDTEQAQQYEGTAQQWYGINSNISNTYAEYLLHQGRLDEALAEWQHLHNTSHDKSTYALPLASALTAKQSITSPEIVELIGYATQSTIYPLTEYGAEAWIYAQLYEATTDQEWLQSLTALAEDHSSDFEVRLALAYASIHANPELLLGGELISGTAVELAQIALELAQTPVQQQNAYLQLALAWAYPSIGVVTSEDREAIIDSLKNALGDPTADHPIFTEHPPEYENLLLDENLRVLRTQVPDFDAEINHLITDYLNRQRQRYTPVVTTGELPYRITTPRKAL